MESKQVDDSADGTLIFLRMVSRLKRLKRTGWVNNGVVDPERVSGHMHRMGIMCLLCDDASLDMNQLVKIAIVHDLAEALAGDITPHDGISSSEKFDRENKAIIHMLCQLNPRKGQETGNEKGKEGKGEYVYNKSATVSAEKISNPAGKRIYDLWNSYEKQTSAEARFVKQLDKLEMIVSAQEYETDDQEVENKGLDLDSFFGVRDKIEHPFLRKISDGVCLRHDNRRDGSKRHDSNDDDDGNDAS